MIKSIYFLPEAIALTLSLTYISEKGTWPKSKALKFRGVWPLKSEINEA